MIGAKVANARALDYPASELEVIVACDGSPDATAQRAREAGADVVLELPRGGKIRAQDRRVERARGEIVAFGDANALWEPDALRELVAPFADPRGRLRLRAGPLRQRGGHEPGGPLLALRDGAARARVAAGLGDRRQRRDLRDAPRGLPRRRPVMGHDLSFPFNMVKRGLARRLRAGGTRDGEDGARRSRASSPASGG